MRILVTNDDGIFSPGLLALAEVASKFGEVRIVAPDVEQSAVGHAITILRPLLYKQVNLGNIPAYRVNGTPADCVALGLYHWGGADLVLSGINIGSNLGNEIWHSGTVSAARQAALFNVRSVAFSLEINGDAPNFEAQKPHVEAVLSRLAQNNSPMLVNVNFPRISSGKIVWTHQSVRAYNGKVVEGADPMGRKHFWFAAVPLSEPDQGSDRWAVDHGMISLTPLSLELTDEAWLENLNQ